MRLDEAARPRGPVSSDFLRRLVRRSPIPVLLFEIETLQVIEASDSFLAFVGRDRAALLDTTVLGLSEQPEATRKSMALVAAGVIDGYTRHATLRLPDGRSVEGDLRISACTEEHRRHAVVSLLPPSWAADDAAALQVTRDDEQLTMGTLNGQWVVDRITTGEDPELAFESGHMLNRSFFVAIHPEDVGELMFVAAQASRQRSAAFGRVRLRAPGGGWAVRRVGLQPLDASPSTGHAFVLFDGTFPSGREATSSLEAELEQVVETTVANIRASAIAGWMVTFPTALQLPELSSLTAREYEIVLRLAAGERVRLIAQNLHLGESTVRNHLSAIFRKTGVGSQSELLELLRTRAGISPGGDPQTSATER